MLQPIFGIIFGDDGPLSALARPQASRSNFLVVLRSSDIVILAGTKRRSWLFEWRVAVVLLPKFFGFMSDLAIVGRDGSGDCARGFAGDGEMNRDNTDQGNS
jgi:hypothetical protein